jgi:6-pyruvoyl-tetrahydropterin synthase
MYKYNQDVHFNATHALACGPMHRDGERHHHNYTIKVETELTGLHLDKLQWVTLQLTTFDAYVEERFNGRDLHTQMPLGATPTAANLAAYLFGWLTNLLGDCLFALTVSDGQNPPAKFQLEMPVSVAVERAIALIHENPEHVPAGYLLGEFIE